MQWPHSLMTIRYLKEVPQLGDWNWKRFVALGGKHVFAKNSVVVKNKFQEISWMTNKPLDIGIYLTKAFLIILN